MYYYTLSYTWRETYEPHILAGPSIGDWDTYCEGLLEPAAQRALNKKKDTTDSVGWRDIVESMIELLKEQGFQEIHFPEKCFNGTTHIRDEHDAKNNLSEETFKRLCEQTELQDAKFGKLDW